MNKATILTVFVFLGVTIFSSGWAATKYGNADIRKGRITVLRKGSRLTFRQGDNRVQINHLDVIRVGRESQIVLSTVEKATVTLGSNAVFQVKPWQRKEDKGFFRMLYGRMRAKISRLGASQRFNVHTATATIGVKGTEEVIFLNVQGDSTVGVTESAVALKGRGGGQLNILQGRASGVVGGRTPNVTFAITADFQDLNSVGPTSPDAMRVPLGQLLVQNGVVTQDQVDASELGAAEGVELPGEGIDFSADDGLYDALGILDDQEQGAQDSATETSETKVRVSIQFEN
jgi:hypothetical protein